MREPHRPVDGRPDFPQIEERVLERWREERTFERALAQREDGPVFSFIEGPPTANGNPGSHHVLLRSFKDFYMRYRTMCGYRVPRKAGWDCHGLPVELEVEKQLGFDSKREIEEYGIAAFNERCRESNQHYIRAWERMTERVGFWIDLENAFQTGTPEYIESVWWSLHELWDRGLIYHGHKVVPYCSRCGTALSSHEVAMGYRETTDLTATVKLPVVERRGPLQEGDAFLIWTTQPWTLFANCAVAIAPDVRYVRAKRGDEVFVLAEERVAATLGEEGVEILDRFPGRTIVDARYEPPFDLLPDHGPRIAHRARRRPRHAREGHRPRPHRDGVRRGGLRDVRASRHPARQPCPRGRHLRRADRRLGGRAGRRGDAESRRGAARRRQAARRRAVRPLPSALLALRLQAPLLREGELVHRHARPPPRHAAPEHAHRLASRARARRPLRQLAAGQRRLGALARSLLGHAAADLGVLLGDAATRATASARSTS